MKTMITTMLPVRLWPIKAKSTWRAEQNENEQPHDERGGLDIFLKLPLFAGLHLESQSDPCCR